MAVTYLPRNNNALEMALVALRAEEADVIKDMADLQSRLEALRTAMTSMRSLVSSEITSQPEQRVLKLTDPETGRFAGLPFTKALKSFMDTQREPLTTREATVKFEEAGWAFTADTQNNKINQVGVSFRRYIDKLFKRTEDGKWFSVGGVSDLS